MGAAVQHEECKEEEEEEEEEEDEEFATTANEAFTTCNAALQDAAETATGEAEDIGQYLRDKIARHIFHIIMTKLNAITLLLLGCPCQLEKLEPKQQR